MATMPLLLEMVWNELPSPMLGKRRLQLLFPLCDEKKHYDKVHVGMVWKYFHERTDLLCSMQEYLVAPFEWVVGANGSRWEPLPPIAVRVNKCDLYRKWRKACEDAWLRDLLRPR